jgi:hypothetical protein
MRVAVDISLYPLADDFLPAIVLLLISVFIPWRTIFFQLLRMSLND